MSKTVLLAFSGGLDTSYAAVALREQGYRVVTLYAHSGGGDPAEVEARAKEVGADEHHTAMIADDLFEEVVAPFLMGGARRQGRYPVLCADRYVIARASAELAAKIGADAIAHGCTGMGNDQVRFDGSLRILSSLPVLAPIRDIQDRGDVRGYEMEVLARHGLGVPEKTTRYSINENLLGVTMSGGAIDRWEEPSSDARLWTKGSAPEEPLSMQIRFEAGRPAAIDGEALGGAELLARLNAAFGPHGVGYDIYTGDTLVGLKGRIVFEAPGLTALETAHTALYEAVASAAQNASRRRVGEELADLFYDGRFFDPLRDDLRAYLTSSNRRATGTVRLRTEGSAVRAVAVTSPYILREEGAVYAQSAGWSGEAAEGFCILSAQSSRLWHRVGDGS